MELWELIARESIRDLVARYNASGDAGRFDETLALFEEDATLEIVSQRIYRGTDEIRTLFTGAAGATRDAVAASDPGSRILRHFTASHQIDLTARDEARGRCYYAVLTAAGLDHWGRYVDEYRRRGDRWLFRTRRVTIDASVPGGWAARAAERLAEPRSAT